MKKQIVSIIGLGYVGLPLALRCVEKDYEVFGIDLDNDRLGKIKNGQSPFKEEVVEKRKNQLKKIKTSNNFIPLKKTDIAIICVPTPVDKGFCPILTPLKSAIKEIAKNIKKGQLVIIESTINPGICEEVVEPLFAKTGLKEGKDYYLAHCPERINPGKDTISQGYNVANILRTTEALE